MPTNPILLKALSRSVNFDFVGDVPRLGPEVQAVASRAEAQLRLKMLRAFKGLTPSDDTEASLGEIFKEIESKAAAGSAEHVAIQKNLQTAMAGVNNALASDPVYAPFRAVGITKPGRIDSVSLVAGLSEEGIRKELAAVESIEHEDLASNLGLVVPQGAWSKLRFVVHSIRCLDENDNWFNGNSDEIMLGLNYVNQVGGTGYKFTSTGMSDFDQGETRQPKPSHSTVDFALSNKTFPQSLGCVVSLVELDNGGAAAYIQKIYDAMKGKIAQLADQIGEAIGSIFGAPELGPVISAAIQWVVATFVGWLVGWLNDDYLGSFSATAKINSSTGMWTSTGSSVVSHTRTISGDGAKYVVHYSWQLLA